MRGCRQAVAAQYAAAQSAAEAFAKKMQRRIAMKLTTIAASIVFSFLLAMPAGPGAVNAHGGYGGHHGDYGYEQRGDWNYCPYCGSNFRSQGGSGMGPGMMGPGYGHRYDDPRRPYDRQRREPLKKENVKAILENQLSYSRNPNLKVGKIEDKGFYFEAEITTKDGSLVDKLQVDKETGRMRSIY
jgi:hypothetical protein